MANDSYGEDEWEELDVDANDASGPTTQLLDKVFFAIPVGFIKKLHTIRICVIFSLA